MTRLRLLALSLLCLSLVSNKARAEGDTNVQAQPNAVGNSSIINQNMNVNNGMTGKQQFGNLVCSQPTMAVTPFYTGNDAENTESDQSAVAVLGVKIASVAGIPPLEALVTAIFEASQVSRADPYF